MTFISEHFKRVKSITVVLKSSMTSIVMEITAGQKLTGLFGCSVPHRGSEAWTTPEQEALRHNLAFSYK